MDDDLKFQVGESTRYAMTKNTKVSCNRVDITKVAEDGSILELANGMKIRFVKQISCIWSLYFWIQVGRNILIQNKM